MRYALCSLVAVTPDPEAAARNVLAEFEARFDTRELPPVPADQIATSLLQLDIEEVDDVRSVPEAPSDQGALSGLVVSERKTIYLDRRECRRHPRRRRFTIAHEIGHWVLHISSAGKLYGCRPADIVEQPAIRSDTRELRRIEAEANRFAAELLLPETLVVPAATELGSNVPALADRFGVSVPAIRVRLQQFGLLPAWMGGP